MSYEQRPYITRPVTTTSSTVTISWPAAGSALLSMLKLASESFKAVLRASRLNILPSDEVFLKRVLPLIENDRYWAQYEHVGKPILHYRPLHAAATDDD